ncbi:type IV secretion system protein [Bartonella sp. SD1336NMGDW]|uniref:type IV secretion system protein n=1 Tax=Bartonella sp. SD1336NMGDW TaxID=3243575 RepID=UPI0035CEAC9C
MKKRFIITGMITIWGMINLTLTSNLSWGSGTQGSTVQSPLPVSNAEYLEIINLLKQHIIANENQIKNTEKILQSITGNRMSTLITGESFSYFLQFLSSIYPETRENYQAVSVGEFRKFFRETVLEEKRTSFQELPYYKIREIINTRLKYSGIIEKAVSLQTFQDAENRFTQIDVFLDKINKTKDLKEAFELQTRIKSMSAMIQNEYAKLQMIRSLSDNEESLIEIQKRKLYGKIVASKYKDMPKIRSNQ